MSLRLEEGPEDWDPDLLPSEEGGTGWLVLLRGEGGGYEAGSTRVVKTLADSVAITVRNCCCWSEAALLG